MPSWSTVGGKPLLLGLVALGLQAAAWVYFTGVARGVEVLATGALIGTTLFVAVVLAGYLLARFEDQAKRRR